MIPEGHQKDNHLQITKYLKPIVNKYLIKQFKEIGQNKTSHLLNAEYMHDNGEKALKRLSVHPIYEIKTNDDIETLINHLYDDIEKSEVNALFVGSGWSFTGWHSYEITTYNIKKLRGKKYIELPKVDDKELSGVINIKNDDDKCFYWCMKYHQSNKGKNDYRLTEYEN